MGKLVFLTEKKSSEINVGEKIIDVCSRAGFDMPFGCENGECGVCVGIIKSGEELLEPPTAAELETLNLFSSVPNQRLICQCKVKKDGTIEFERA